MATEIPTASQLRKKLQAMSWAQVQQLSRATGAPFTTIWKIREGQTTDPRLETVRLIWPELIGVEDAPPVPSCQPEETRNAA